MELSWQGITTPHDGLGRCNMFSLQLVAASNALSYDTIYSTCSILLRMTPNMHKVAMMLTPNRRSSMTGLIKFTSRTDLLLT